MAFFCYSMIKQNVRNEYITWVKVFLMNYLRYILNQNALELANVISVVKYYTYESFHRNI